MDGGYPVTVGTPPPANLFFHARHPSVTAAVGSEGGGLGGGGGCWSRPLVCVSCGPLLKPDVCRASASATISQLQLSSSCPLKKAKRKWRGHRPISRDTDGAVTCNLSFTGSRRGADQPRQGDVGQGSDEERERNESPGEEKKHPKNNTGPSERGWEQRLVLRGYYAQASSEHIFESGLEPII